MKKQANELVFMYRSVVVAFRHGGPSHGHAGEDVLGLCTYHDYDRRATVWISPQCAQGTPAFYNTLAHELVHLAGFLLLREGADASRDPREENLPGIVGDLTEAVHRGLNGEASFRAAETRLNYDSECLCPNCTAEMEARLATP